MNHKTPVNVLNEKKHKDSVLDYSNLVSIKTYKNSTNITKPFTKPISKIF